MELDERTTLKQIEVEGLYFKKKNKFEIIGMKNENRPNLEDTI
jgi:hypothetical protein